MLTKEHHNTELTNHKRKSKENPMSCQLMASAFELRLTKYKDVPEHGERLATSKEHKKRRTVQHCKAVKNNNEASLEDKLPNERVRGHSKSSNRRKAVRNSSKSKQQEQQLKDLSSEKPQQTVCEHISRKSKTSKTKDNIRMSRKEYYENSLECSKKRTGKGSLGKERQRGALLSLENVKLQRILSKKLNEYSSMELQHEDECFYVRYQANENEIRRLKKIHSLEKIILIQDINRIKMISIIKERGNE